MHTLQPFHDRDGVLWLDGTFVPWREANLHVLTHGLHYASTVFEGERFYKGQVFALREHTIRFHQSAQYLDFDIPYSIDEIEAATYQMITQHNLEDGYVRPVAWRGSEMMGVSAVQSHIHVAIAVWEWPSYFSAEARNKGIHLQTAQWRRPSPHTAPTQAKAAGLYMICTVSKHKAEAQGFHDALMLDYRGQVAETTGANIFIVQDEKLHTPIPDCFLDGITRRTVINLAQKRGIEIIERAIWPEELAHATEIFITGTAAEITPISRIDDQYFKVGEMTHTLLNDFYDLVHTPTAE